MSGIGKEKHALIEPLLGGVRRVPVLSRIRACSNRKASLTKSSPLLFDGDDGGMGAFRTAFRLSGCLVVTTKHDTLLRPLSNRFLPKPIYKFLSCVQCPFYRIRQFPCYQRRIRLSGAKSRTLRLQYFGRI